MLKTQLSVTVRDLSGFFNTRKEASFSQSENFAKFFVSHPKSLDVLSNIRNSTKVTV